MASSFTHRRARAGRAAFIRTCLFLCVSAGMTLSVRADEVILADGSVIQGEIVSLSQGRLYFKSDPLGRLTIKIDKIKSLQTDAATAVLLQESDQARQVRLIGAQEGVYLDDGAQRQLVPLHAIAALGPAVEKIKKHKPLGLNWTGSFEAGITGRSGNTQRFATIGNALMEGADKDWLFRSYLSAIYAEQEDDGQIRRTDNEIKGGLRLQKMMTDRLSAFIQMDAEKDEIEELKFRAVVNSGLGIRWIKTDRLFYENRVGFGCQHEEFDDGTRLRSAVGELTSELRYQLNSRVKLTQETRWIQDFDDFPSYRITAESAAVIHLNETGTFFFKSGIKHDYNNQPVRDVERLDTYYFSNIGYRF